MTTLDKPDPAYLAESRVAMVNILYAIPIPLELLTTGLRLFIGLRTAGKKSPNFDDTLMIIATILSVGVCISGLVFGPPHGFGRHIEAVSAEDMKMFMLGNYIFSHFYDAAIVFTKLSVLALYHRIFATQRFRQLVIGTAVVMVLWLFAMEIVLGFQCRPISAFWDASVKGKCFNLVSFSYFTNVMNLVSDLWIFSLPLPTILGLRLSQKKKIGLCIVFSIGLAACGISAARLTVVVCQGSTDFTWSLVPLGVLSAFEPLAGILCANLPVIYTIVAKGVKKMRTKHSESSAHRSHTGGFSSIPRSRGWSTRGSSRLSTDNSWMRLPNGNSPGDYKAKISAPISIENGTKLAPLTGKMIVVETQFQREEELRRA